jgi:ABC-type lipoprotein export system ATPase subunit
MVIVTHNLDLARKAQKMYTLKDGQIVGCEDLACVFGRDDIRVQQDVV